MLSLSGYKELKRTKKPFTGHALRGLLIQMQNISFRSLGMLRQQNFKRVLGFEGQVLNLRDKFQILQIERVKISAWSLHTQNGMTSGPVAVFFRCCKQFHTCLSEISGTWTPLSTWAGVGCLYALSQVPTQFSKMMEYKCWKQET